MEGPRRPGSPATPADPGAATPVPQDDIIMGLVKMLLKDVDTIPRTTAFKPMPVVAFCVYIAGQPRYRDAFSCWSKSREFEAFLAMLNYSQSGNKRDAIRIIETYLSTNSTRAITLQTANEIRNGEPSMGRTDHYRAYFQQVRGHYIESREQASQMNFLRRTWTAGSRKADLDLFEGVIGILENRIDLLQARPWAEATPVGAEALRKYETYGCLHSRKTALEKVKVQELHLSNAAYAAKNRTWF